MEKCTCSFPLPRGNPHGLVTASVRPSAIEKVPAKFTKSGERMRRPVARYVEARSARAPSGETWEDRPLSRIELNAFTSGAGRRKSATARRS